MKKVLLSLAICLSALSGFSQSVSLPQANVTPAPLPSVGNDGVGVGVFTFAESSGIPVQATAFGMPNVTISVNLQYVELTDGDISGITGTLLDYFVPSYNAATNILTFQQTTIIPGDWFGSVSMPFTVIQNSTQEEAFNGFNANIASIDGVTNAEGNAAVFSYTTSVPAIVEITEFSTPGDTLDVSVEDPDLNEDPLVAETIEVVVVNDVTGESETITLTETGPDTGVFEGTVDTTYGTTPGTDDDGTFNTQEGDTVTVTYEDELNENGTSEILTDTDTVLGGVTGTVDITDFSVPGDTLDVVVEDNDLNEDPLVAETIEVVVVNDVTGESETITLTETGPDTGVFEGTVDTTFGTTPGTDDDGTINTQEGDTVTVTYDDELDADGSDPAPVTDTDIVQGGVTGTVDITDFSVPGDTLDVVVEDNDLNEDPLVAETIEVVVVNDVTGESETITLTETGPDTGVFEGTVDTTFGTTPGTDDDGTINTQEGDTVTVTYDDVFDAEGSDPAPVTDTDIVQGGVTGTVDITDFSVPGDTLDVVVEDNDLNEDPLVAETIEVVVVNDVTGESETITLTETGPDTGVFEGTVDTTFGTTPGTDDDGTINTQEGDTVTVTYDDVFDAEGSDPAPVTDTDVVQGGVTGTVDITDFSVPGDTLDVVVEDNDLNEDPLVAETIEVVVVNDVTGESETITLTETGPDTGVFEGTVDTTFGTTPGTDDDGTFNTQAGDTVTVTYDDVFDAEGSDPAPVTDTDVVQGGVTGTVDITDFSVPGDTLDVVVEDNDLNEDPLVAETIEVVVVNDVTGESETITLTETGPDTGVFEGTVDTTFGTTPGTDDDGTINTQAGDTVTVTYDDVFDAEGSDPAPVTDTDVVQGGVTGTVDITDFSVPGDTLDVVVEDNDLNEDPLVAETIEVVVVNDVTGESETITLTETGPDTGVFEGTVDTTFGTTPGTDDDGTINTQEGDTVTVTYDDVFDAEGSDPAPVTDTDVVQGGVTGTVDITDFSFPGDTLDVVVTDNDLNEDPLVAETIEVVVVNDVTGESETITLTETGPDTGVFEGTVDTTYGTTPGTDDDGTFNTQAGDTVTVTYDDVFDAEGSDPAPVTDTDVVQGGVTGTVDITDFSVPGDTLDVVVEDNDLNEDPLVAETIEVIVVNDVTGESETITLTETGPDTGVFEGTVDTTFGTTPGTDDDGTFNTQAGDTVTVTYDDVFDEIGADPTPITDTDVVQGGVTGTVDITDFSVPGDTLDVVVEDNDLNEDPLVAETIEVIVVNDVTGESETITLTETGPDTGVFEGTVDTTFGTTPGTDDDGTFNTQAGDTVTVTYDDVFDAEGSDPTPVTDTDVVQGGVTGTVDITDTSVPGDVLDIVVTDNDLNEDPLVIETIEVVVVNDSTGESETITLTETGPDTGVFEGTVDTTYGTTPGTDDDGTFNTQSGNTVTVTYDDVFDAEGMDPDPVTDTDIVGDLPDFGPTIFTGNTTIIGGTGVIDFRVFVAEYNNRFSNGTDPVELRIIKNSDLVITYDGTLTTINGSAVSNQDWTFDDSHPSLYKFTYVGNGGVFLGNTASNIGINAIYNPPANTNGSFPVKATIKYFSGGEINNSNNDDFDYIEYNNN